MSTVKNRSTMDFTEGPMLIKILKFALPLMATAFLQTLYNASDMIIVGNFSPNGTFSMGAVGACSSLISLCVNLFIGLGTGVGICVAQSIGAKRSDDVRKYVHTAALVALICGIAVGIFGFCFADMLLTLMGTPSNLLVEAAPYMRAYFVGMPAMLIYNFLASALRSSGDAKRPLIFLTVSGIVNVIFNIIMVCVFNMGAVGVGIATTVSQYASAVMILVYMMKTSGDCRFIPRELAIHKKMLIGILKNGVPLGMQSVLFSISNVLIQSSINQFGDIAVTGASAASNVENFVYVPMHSIYQAETTVIGQNMGAGKYERIKKATFASVVMVSIIGIMLGVLFTVFGDFFLSIYEPGQGEVSVAVREAGMVKLTCICLPYFLCGVMECVGGTIEGMGKAVVSMMTTLFGVCGIRIAWIYAVRSIFPNNMYALYLVYPVTWIITICGLAAFAVVIYRHIKRDRDGREAMETERISDAVSKL